MAQLIVWGKPARHKSLEADGDATVDKSRVTQTSQPREGVGYEG